MLKIVKGSGAAAYPVHIYISHYKEIIKKFAEIVRQYYGVDLALWCRGTSGVLLSSMLKLELESTEICNISINLIRKPDETSHDITGMQVNHLKNIIVDDFIASGYTVNTIINEIENCKKEIDCMLFLSPVWNYNRYEELAETYEVIGCLRDDTTIPLEFEVW